MIKYQYVFGPIFSKRLGFSLGIDLLGKKICSFNCVYCEISKTEILTLNPKNYVSIEKVFFELDYFFLFNPKIRLDCITLSGKGEPTLHIHIEEVIKYLHINYSYPVCILTNSSLLPISSIRKRILSADIIMPSLNAVSKKAYRKINLHHSSICVEEIIKGLFLLREEFSGYFCLEILFVKGINDHDKEIELLKGVVKKLQPDDVYINTIYRPPAFSRFEKIDTTFLEKLFKEFKDLLISNKRKENLYIKSIKRKSNLTSKKIVSKKEILNKLKMILYVRPSLENDLQKIMRLYGYNLKEKEWNKIISLFISKGILVKRILNDEEYIYLNHLK